MSCPRCINEMILWPCPHKEPMRFNLPTRGKDKERWVFKPSNLNNNYEFTVEPTDALVDYVREMSQEVTRKIMEAEEDLLLRTFPDKVLNRLKELIIIEQDRRKDKKNEHLGTDQRV